MACWRKELSTLPIFRIGVTKGWGFKVRGARIEGEGGQVSRPPCQPEVLLGFGA